MAKDDDWSGDHFDWLVEGRSRNQQTTLELHKLIEANDALLEDNIECQTDFNAREWTSRYYLDNDLARLKTLPEQILPLDQTVSVALSAKDDWTTAQAALAAYNLKTMIAGVS